MCECDECVRFVDDDQCLSGARVYRCVSDSDEAAEGVTESLMMMCESDKAGR